MVNSTLSNPSDKPKAKSGAQPRNISWGKFSIYAVLLVGVFFSLLPFLWMLSWSLMTRAEVVIGQSLPTSVQWENYPEAWVTAEFANLIWNSVRIVVISIGGLLLFCVPAAYAFARMKFWGRNVLFTLTLATLILPDIVTLIPNYLTVIWFDRLGRTIFGSAGAWINNWPSLTIPFMASAFSIFLLRQFFAQIPDDLWDAARMDGASHLQFLFRVVIPLSTAPIMTIVLFAFVGSWNSLLWPILVANNSAWEPVALGLRNFVSDNGNEFHLQMAASVIMILPVVVLYFFTQKQFTEGLYSGSLKG